MDSEEIIREAEEESMAAVAQANTGERRLSRHEEEALGRLKQNELYFEVARSAIGAVLDDPANSVVLKKPGMALARLLDQAKLGAKESGVLVPHEVLLHELSRLRKVGKISWGALGLIHFREDDE